MPDAAATETLSPFSIAPATGVGAVHLAVTDGEQALAFYRDVLGLALLSRTGEEIRLGAGGRELVVLTPGASRQVLDRTTGLYHLALLVPDRRELARVVGRLMSLRYPNSPTDHVMTKSDYLWDPDKPAHERPEMAVDLFLDLLDGRYELLLKGYQVAVRRHA